MKEFKEAKMYVQKLEKNIQEVSDFKRLHDQYAENNLYDIGYKKHLDNLFSKQDELSEILEGVLESMREKIGLKDIDLLIEISEDLIHLMSIGNNSYMNKYYWEEKLINVEKDYQFSDGYKLLFCPWEMLSNQSINTALISLNPGAAPDDADLRMISEEGGNSYQIEKTITKSKITDQILQLYKFLKLKPASVLTGAAHPFRGDTWDDFNEDQKKVGLSIGKEFWTDAIKNIDQIIVLGEEAKCLINEIVNPKLELEIPSGWGNIRLRRYRGADGVSVVHLPHLSRFKIFGKDECVLPLKRIFKS